MNTTSSYDDKSLFLKECIADAFFRLMKTKHFKKITVNDIVSIAGVGRMTYFRNFQTKYDIVQFKLKTLSKEYYSKLPKRPKSRKSSAYHLLCWIYTNREIFSLLYRQEPIIILLYFGHNAVLNDDNDTDNLYKQPFFINGFSGLVCKWAERDFKESPDEMISMLQKWILF